MSSHVTREMERKKAKKKFERGVEKLEASFRRKFRRPPTAAEMQSIRDNVASAMSAQERAASDLPVKLTPQPRPQGGLTLTTVGEFKEDGSFELSPGVKPEPEMMRRLEFLRHCSQFQAAKTHAEQLKHLQGALWGLLPMAGIQNAWLEAPPVIAALADIDDLLAGRTPRLLSRLNEPVLPSPGNRAEPTRKWIASAFIVGLGMSVQKHAGLTIEPALLKVIADLEAKLKAPIDDFLTAGRAVKLSADLSARDARRKRLAERFEKEHRPKLLAGEVPRAAKWVFDDIRATVDKTPPDELAGTTYEVWLLTAESHVRQAQDRPDTKAREKVGKLYLSTPDGA